MIEPLKIKFKPYAMTDDISRGRREKEDALSDDFRSQFQHDRDRIIHSKAFRRLESKTQVVISHESDHNRKRLTHSLEVMQMSDSIAYALGVNIFLTQAIALGHDLGHAPYGHIGERTLSEILKDHDLPGFKHNYQSLLLVNKLATGYRDDAGLNLMYETRDGILHHTKLRDDIVLDYYDTELDKKRKYPITIEGQIVRLVDEIAQRSHDTDDGLRTHRITLHEILQQPITKSILTVSKLKESELAELFKTDQAKAISKIVVAIIKAYILDAVKTTYINIKRMGIKKYADVGKSGDLIVTLSKGFKKMDGDFRDDFLYPNFYGHYEIKRMDARGHYFIRQLFKAFKKNPGQLPENDYERFTTAMNNDLMANKLRIVRNCGLDGCVYKARNRYVSGEKKNKCPLQKKKGRACEGIRVIINSLAGMTDRHANLEYSRLYLPPEISRM